MKINRKNAFILWEMYYGNQQFAKDFHGNIMYKYAYGNPDYYVYNFYYRVYCGWNLHHILPKAWGGTNVKDNLICTNIITNAEAADKITFWIDDCLYQVKKTENGHDIFKLN